MMRTSRRRLRSVGVFLATAAVFFNVERTGAPRGQVDRRRERRQWRQLREVRYSNLGEVEVRYSNLGEGMLQPERAGGEHHV